MNSQTFWYDNAVFYHIYPLGMCGAPASQDGICVSRILEVIDWIPHLQHLGVNAIYFGPVFHSVRHGYDTTNYYEIDPRLGTNEDFALVCKTLHKEGFYVVLDGVFNHVGREFAPFLDVKEKREGSGYCSWFSGLNFYNNNSYNDGFSYDSWSGCEDLVKLNLYEPAVRKHLLDAIDFWMREFEIDGLRLDAADCIQRDFFKELRYFVKSRRADFWLMGEIIHGNYNVWANNEMLDSVTNYECWKGIYSSHNDKNYFEIAHSLNREFGRGGMYEGIRLYNFLDNHDVNRIGSLLKVKENLANVYTLLFTMPGIPSIYYGSEWGIMGEKGRGADADLPLRPALSLPDMQQAGSELCDHIARLAKAYHEHPALRFGTYENVVIKNEQLVYARAYEDETILVAFNVTDAPVELNFNYKGKAYDVSLDAFESKILIYEDLLQDSQ